MPAGEPVQERIDVPEPPEILVELRVQERPVGVAVTDSVTVPVNPFAGLTDMVDVAATPALTLMLVGVALMLKSGTFVT